MATGFFVVVETGNINQNRATGIFEMMRESLIERYKEQGEAARREGEQRT